MAQQILVRLVDDLDDTVIDEGQGQTVRFGIDSQQYEIDLTNEHAGELREAFSRYVQAARKVSGQSTRSTSSRSSKSDVSPQAVRQWAKANKVELSARGRIPQSIVEKFKAAGN